MVYSGHGQKDHLMCRGAHDYVCWSALTVNGPLAARKMIASISGAFAALPDYDPTLLRLVQEEQRQLAGAQGQ